MELSRQENTLLRQKIDALVRRVFGSSSERLDRAQLELLLQLPSPVTADTTVRHRGRRTQSLRQPLAKRPRAAFAG